MMKVRRASWFLVVGLMWGPCVLDVRADSCDHPLGFFQSQHYVVKDITVEAPFDLFQTVRRAVDLNQLPLKAVKVEQGATVQGGEFDTVAYSLADATVRDQIYQQMDPNDRLNAVLVLPSLRSCDEAQHTLDVAFRVYSLAVPTSLATGFASTPHTLLKRLSTEDAHPVLTSLIPQLSVGYDTARHLYGGGHFLYQAKPSGLFDTITLDGAGSSSSLLFHGDLKGSRNWTQSGIRHAEWALGYSASDIPSNTLQLADGKVGGRFSAASRQLFDQALVLYFGSAIEAGNQHATGAPPPPDAGLVSSQVGSWKSYLGAAFSVAHNNVKASYGIQAGKSSPGVHVDYVKHIVNVAYSARALPMDHHPLTVDVQFGAGWLSNTSHLPLSERFFGGNLDREFIPGDFWHIQSAPVIRSFSAYGLDLASQGQTGGTNFFSANTTLGYVIWGRPLIPQSVLGEAEHPLLAQLDSGEASLVNNYLADLPAIQRLEADVFASKADFVSLREKVNALKNTPGLPADVSDQVDTVLDDLDTVDERMALLDHPPMGIDGVNALLFLISSFPSSLKALAADVNDLADALGDAGMSSQQTDIAARQAALQSMQAAFRTRYDSIDQTEVKAKAKAGMKYARSVLKELLHGLNLYSVAPAVLFDAARIGPQRGPFQAGTRYGIGPAVRLGLLNFDVTVGYSFNPSPMRGERRGATVFTIGIGDIFR